MLAQLLSKAGLFLGWDLIGANASNPYGHYEDREVVSLHNKILERHGLSWHIAEPFVPLLSRGDWNKMMEVVSERRKESVAWGFKDPRVCFFLSAWKHVVPQARICLIYRHPNEAVESLERRQSTDLFQGRGQAELHRKFWSDPDHGLKMWICHNRALVRFIRAHPDDVHVVSLDDLVVGRSVVSELNQRWDLGLEEVETERTIERSLVGRSERPRLVSDQNLIDDALDLWTQLEGWSRASNG